MKDGKRPNLFVGFLITVPVKKVPTVAE